VVLDSEDSGEYYRLLSSYLQDLQPAGGVERDLAGRLAVASWRLRRIAAMEANLFSNELLESQPYLDRQHADMDADARVAWVFQNMANNQKCLSQLLRYESQIQRLFDRTLKQLQQLQAKRQNEPKAQPVQPLRLGGLAHDTTPLPETSSPSPIIDSSTAQEANPDEHRILSRKSMVGEPLQRSPRGPQHVPAAATGQHS
jgi:hypothetical protein